MLICFFDTILYFGEDIFNLRGANGRGGEDRIEALKDGIVGLAFSDGGEAAETTTSVPEEGPGGGHKDQKEGRGVDDIDCFKCECSRRLQKYWFSDRQ